MAAYIMFYIGKWTVTLLYAQIVLRCTTHIKLFNEKHLYTYMQQA